MSSSTSSVMNQPQHQQQQQHMEESEHQHVWGNKTTASETGRNNVDVAVVAKGKK